MYVNRRKRAAVTPFGRQRTLLLVVLGHTIIPISEILLKYWEEGITAFVRLAVPAAGEGGSGQKVPYFYHSLLLSAALKNKHKKQDH
jgi:hypothetical protein